MLSLYVVAAAESSSNTISSLGAGAMPCQGSPKAVVFLVSFTDSAWAPSSGDVTYWNNVFFSPDLMNSTDASKAYSYQDSLRSFYYRSSYGKLDITGDVYACQLQHEASYYTEFEMIVNEVVARFEDRIDWKVYDSDNDGYTDGLYVLPFGDPVWERSDEMSFMTPMYNLSVDGVNISRAVYISRNAIILDAPVTTIAHETFHLLGITDLYGGEFGNFMNPDGLKTATILDFNSGREGDIPGLCKQLFGWVDTPHTLTGAGEWEIELSSISVTDDMLIVHALGDPENRNLFVIEYVTTEANNQRHNGIRIWRTEVNGSKALTRPTESLHPFEYIEAICPEATLNYYFQPGDSFTPWTKLSSAYATAYEDVTSGFGNHRYIKETAYSGIYIDVLSMDGKTAKVRVRIEPTLDLTGEVATVQVVDPSVNGIFLDQNDMFTFASISCPYDMAVNGQFSIRHSASGTTIPVSSIMSDDRKLIRLLITKKNLPQIQLDQEYTIQLPGLVTAFNGDELSFGDFSGSFVFKDIPVSLSLENQRYPYGSMSGTFRYFRRNDAEICYLVFDRTTQESALQILNIETNELTEVPLETCVSLCDMLSINASYLADESQFNIWQVDDKHFAVSFEPVYTYGTWHNLACYRFDGQLVSEISCSGGMHCIGQGNKRYLVRNNEIQEVILNSDGLMPQPLEYPLEDFNEFCYVYNFYEVSEGTYVVTYWQAKEISADGSYAWEDMFPVTAVFRKGKRVATIPDAGWYDCFLPVGNELYLIKLTDEKLMIDILDENATIKQQVLLLENLPVDLYKRSNSITSTLFNVEYADDMLFISFNNFSDLYDRSYFTTYVLAYDSDFHLKYYFHSSNEEVRYGTPAYIGNNVFFYGMDNCSCSHLSLSSCTDPDAHIQTRKHGKPATQTECGWTDGIVCGLCGEVLVAPQLILHKNCTTLPGDADCSGRTNLMDALLILQHVAGWEEKLCINNADANKDGTIDIADILQVLIAAADGDLEGTVHTFSLLARDLNLELFAIVAHPTDLCIPEGQDAAFSILATDPEADYRWYVSHDNGRSWSEVAQTDSNTCTITSATLADDGDLYRCIIENDEGYQLVSDAAALYVLRDTDIPATGDQTDPLLLSASAFISLGCLLVMLFCFCKSSRVW